MAQKKRKGLRILGGILTGGASELANKKSRKKIGTIATAPLWLPLLPLKPVMIKALNRKGHTTSKKAKLNEVAVKFYNEIVRHKAKVDGYDYVDLANDYDNDADNVVGATAGAVVAGIVSFVKSLKKQKEEGKKLTKTEAEIVDGAEKVETSLKEKAEEEVATDIGTKILRGNWLIIGLVAIAAYFIFRKK